MEITLKNIDPVNAIIKINIVKEDYATNVETSLKKIRQRADIPGFRKGMVPMGMINKLYKSSMLAEELNKIIPEKLHEYISENNLKILGDPLPNETEQAVIDFDTQENFDFYYDIALAPEVKIELTKKDKLPYYTVTIDDETLNKQIELLQAEYGAHKQVDKFDGEDMLKGVLTEWENDAPKIDGLIVEDAVLMPSVIKTKSEAVKFDKAKKGDFIVFNPNKAHEGNETEIASFLKVNKKDVEQYTGDFSYEVKEIVRFEKAEINQDFFEKVFPGDKITTEADFKEKLRLITAEQYTSTSEHKFLQDFRKLVAKKLEKVQLPEAFLKRWILASDKKQTAEDVELNFPDIIENLKFQLAQEQLVQINNIKVENTEIFEYAKKVVSAQFARFGASSDDDSMLESYAQNILKNEETVRRIHAQIIEDKLAPFIHEQVKVDKKELPLEEFSKLLQ